MAASKATEQYKVSVVMPVYNAAEFLARAISSVTGQSHRNLELILVDDGSADDSLNICRQFAAVDSRLNVLSQANAGPAAARNTGVRSAAGDFVFFLDADDYLETETFDVLLHAYVDNPVDLVMANFSKLENDGRIVQKDVVFQSDGTPFSGELLELSSADISRFVMHFLESPSNHLISYCWARLYKLSIIREHHLKADESMRLFEDFVFNLEYLQHVDRLLFVNRHFYIYVMHNIHVSASMGLFKTQSLLHDMAIFRERTQQYLLATGETPGVAAQATAHTLIHYLIIFLVRACRAITAQNRQHVQKEIASVTGSPLIVDCLPHYRPRPGNSKLLPYLMKYRLVKLIIATCRYKANRRYGKG